MGWFVLHSGSCGTGEKIYGSPLCRLLDSNSRGMPRVWGSLGKRSQPVQTSALVPFEDGMHVFTENCALNKVKLRLVGFGPASGSAAPPPMVAPLVGFPLLFLPRSQVVPVPWGGLRQGVPAFRVLNSPGCSHLLYL
eukprot:181429-Amphidinium_carterae.2